MSDLAIIKGDDLSAREAEILANSLSERDDTDFLVVTADVESMDERQLKEMLGRMIGKLEYHLSEDDV